MRLVLIGLVLAVSACSANGTTGAGGFQAPPIDADYGPEPNAEADAKAYFEQILKDPASAQYIIDYVGKAYCNKGTLWGGDVVWHGYAANLYVNAKNSFGGYTGFKPYTLVWRPDGSVSRHIDGADFGNSSWGAGLCRWANGLTTAAGN